MKANTGDREGEEIDKQITDNKKSKYLLELLL